MQRSFPEFKYYIDHMPVSYIDSSCAIKEHSQRCLAYAQGTSMGYFYIKMAAAAATVAHFTSTHDTCDD